MRIPTLLALLTILSLGTPALARDDALHLSFATLLKSPEAREKLDGSVRFYLAGQKVPKVVERLSTDVANRKTNSVGKEPEQACQWAALSALLALQDKAKKLGANAVVDIISYYKKTPFRSATEYECHDGAMMTGVALQGTFARVQP